MSSVVATIGLAAGAVSPAFAEVFSTTPTTWAYVDSAAPQSAFVNRPGDARLGTTVGADHKAHTYRSYFTFDLTHARGQVIHMANFYSQEVAVNNCAASAPVEVWRTKPIKANSTWKNPPAELQRIIRFDAGAGGFCPGYLGVDLLPVVIAALNRHETSLTVELRIAKAKEADPALGRTATQPGLGISANHAPTLSNAGLYGSDQPCGTPARHAMANSSAQFTANVSDVDEFSGTTTTVAVWPVGHPDERRLSAGYGGSAPIISFDLSAYPEGTVLAWSMQADDFTDTSAWSSPCYLGIDRTPPTKAPVGASSLYREGTVAYGGPGVKGRFRFDAQGDRDTVAFDYFNGFDPTQRVAARHPGGSAFVDYTPSRSGPQWLDVTAVDAAGNRGVTTRYQFFVRNTAPYGAIDVAGVGLPSRITLSSSAPEVTGFSYQLDGQAEVRFPAVNGTGTSSLTFTTIGNQAVTVRSYAGNKMIGVDKLWANVSDAPQVDSAEFGFGNDVVVGTSGSFSFKPRAAGVVAYVYDFGDGSQRIDAAADGTAVLQWTPTVGRFYSLYVQSVLADGSLSQPTYYQFNVIDNHPSVYVSGLTDSPRHDGVGLPLDIEFTSYLPNLTGFVYTFNGGAEQTIATNGNVYARITVTPAHAGKNTIVVRGVLADGSRTPETTSKFSVFNGPVVSWSPDGQGTVDKPVTFTFRPGLAGVQEYRYSIDDGEQTVAAGPDGSATVTFTPRSSSNIGIRVTSVGADGTTSDERLFYFYVRSNLVSVYSSYSESSPRGGIGTSAFFQFYSELFGEIVEYRYHVDGDPEQSVPASTEGTTTATTVTLTHNGLNTLYVQGATATGELTPVTAYRFLVGTAPHVGSAQYPENTWSGGAGVTGTFEFSGGTAGIVSYDYQLDFGAVSTVAADANGYAAITYTPEHDFEQHTLQITGHLADGTATDSTSYTFYVFTVQ